jgi:hypothetical protein
LLAGRRRVSEDNKQIIGIMKEQLLIALVRRLGGTVEVSAEEIDDAERFKLVMETAPGAVFWFTVVDA